MASRPLSEELIREHSGPPSRYRTNYGSALLDVAQDHLLSHLAEVGCFDRGTLALKGGTALRKCRLGGAGRFSTDFDFVATDDDTIQDVCSTIHGAEVYGFQFFLQRLPKHSKRWDLQVSHPDFGEPDVQSWVEFAPRPLAVSPEWAPFVAQPIHDAYDFYLPEIPVATIAEACSEKLARYRRKSLVRDLYDLSMFSTKLLNEDDKKLVRRLWILKTWVDVNVDGYGTGPVKPMKILTPREAGDFDPDSIGKLTQEVDIPAWTQDLIDGFQFLTNLDKDEQRWAECHLSDKTEVIAALNGGGYIPKPPT